MAREYARTLVKTANATIDLLVIAVALTVTAVASFSLMQERQVTDEARPSIYERFRPLAQESINPFEELQELNPEVIGWLRLEGTNIDYPVAQSRNNHRYLNTNAFGEPSLSGALFLDAENDPSFSDFTSIIHGHHMANGTMFGELERYSDASFFDAHPFGSLYFDGREHGLEIFAFREASTTDWFVYQPQLHQDEDRQRLFEEFSARSVNYRDIGLSVDDRLVLMGTCAPDSANGRSVLAARLVDQTPIRASLFVPQETAQEYRWIVRPRSRALLAFASATAATLMLAPLRTEKRKVV